jgi:multidrug efflux pump subunit AcrA (membrane-fusion protein)
LRRCLLLLGRCSARAAAALALLSVLTAAIAQPAGAPGPPPAVTVTAAQSRPTSCGSEFLGRSEAIQAVDLGTRVDGFLQQVSFHEGQDVHAGDLLYVIELDPCHRS